MKRHLIFLFSILLTFDVFANINFIDITKIGNDSDSKYVLAYHDIKFNQQLYNHWANTWTNSKPKSEVVQTLRDHYTTFAAITTKNTELYLLLGDISHFLYNLDDTAYYNIAVSHYTMAAQKSPSDFRCYWFLGNHYALSNVPVKAFDCFQKAEIVLPTAAPADFWNEYAMASAFANMPSHCIYAMDKVKSITGKEGYFETQFGPDIRKRIVPIDKNKDYPKEEIWGANKGDKTIFLSRPLGIKVLLEPSWKASPYDYQKKQGIFIIEPPKITNKKGKEISYSILITMKTVNDDEKLSDHLRKFTSQYPNNKKITFSNKYEKMEAYEIQDKTLYKDIGGAHIYIVGIERNMPKHPGLLLENPVVLPNGTSDQVHYYRANESKNRFKGKIFYTIILDSCEDINKETLAIFKNLFENQIIIE